MNRLRHTCSLSMMFAACASVAFMPREALGLVIFNETPHILAVAVGDDNPWNAEIAAGQQAAIDLVAPVNTDDSSDAAYLVEVTIVDGPLFFGRIEAPAHGEVVVRTAQSPRRDLPEEDKNLHVSSYAADGVLFDESFTYAEADDELAARGQRSAEETRALVDPINRDVRFLAIGDPQYFDHRCCNAAGETNPNGDACPAPYNLPCPESVERGHVADNTADQCVTELITNPLLRGVVVAGDLTQTAGIQDEFQQYLDSWHDHLPWVYEGLGNHDYGLTGYQIRNNIRNRARTTVVNPGPIGAPPLLPAVPHYSWDWHDVHFVQLNLMPADNPDSSNPQLNPGNALTFLINDLAAQVGDSGRPVVLIHHYGFDEQVSLNPGNEWWSPEQHLAYWEALANYNVKVILTGHWHAAPYSASQLIRWNRPTEAQGGPSFLYNLNVSASHNGKYVRLWMGPHNLTTVEVVNDLNGTIAVRANLLKDDAVYVNGNQPWGGDGSQRYPWKFMQYASAGLDALAAQLAGNSIQDVAWPLPMRIQAGNYPGGVTFSTATRLEAQGGLVTIGN